jgi:hypothetical protein
MYSLIALVVAFLAWGAVSFGTGFHYGHAAVAPLKAVIKEAKEKNVTDTKANATVALDVGKDDKAQQAIIDADERKQRDLEHRLLVANSNLATVRLILRDHSTDTGGGQVGAAAQSGYQGAVKPTDPAGGSDSCQSVLAATVTSSGVNNAELKRAIAHRDACVTQYEAVQHHINGE